MTATRKQDVPPELDAASTRPPSPRVETPKKGEVAADSGGGGGRGHAAGTLVEQESGEPQPQPLQCSQKQQQQELQDHHHHHYHHTQQQQSQQRQRYMHRLSPPQRPQQQQQEEEEGSGLPNLDVDALRHSLSFLLSGDLARFALASTAAREIVSGHAALIIAERYAGRVRLGVREARPQSSPRRLTFGAGAPQGGVAGGGSGPGGGAAPAPPAQAQAHNVADGNEDAVLNNPNTSHNELWDQSDAAAEQSSGRRGLGAGPSAVDGAAAAAVAASVTTAPLGGGGREQQRLRRRDRHRGAVGDHAEFSRYGGGTLDLALPALHHLECCGDLLVRQLKTLPRCVLYVTAFVDEDAQGFVVWGVCRGLAWGSSGGLCVLAWAPSPAAKSTKHYIIL